MLFFFLSFYRLIRLGDSNTKVILASLDLLKTLFDILATSQSAANDTVLRIVVPHLVERIGANNGQQAARGVSLSCLTDHIMNELIY